MDTESVPHSNNALEAPRAEALAHLLALLVSKERDLLSHHSISPPCKADSVDSRDITRGTTAYSRSKSSLMLLLASMNTETPHAKP